MSKRCLQMFLEGSNWNGWIDRRWKIIQKRRDTRVKSSYARVGLDPMDQQTNSFVWSQWTGCEWWSKHGVKINMLFFMKCFVGQQIILNNILHFTGSQWRDEAVTVNCNLRQRRMFWRLALDHKQLDVANGSQSHVECRDKLCSVELWCSSS